MVGQGKTGNLFLHALARLSHKVLEENSWPQVFKNARTKKFCIGKILGCYHVDRNPQGFKFMIDTEVNMFSHHRLYFLIATVVLIMGFTVCQTLGQVSVLKTFPLNDTKGIITKSNVHFDKTVSSDGKGSIRIEVSEPTTVKLFEVSDINVEDARLIYQARVRAEKLQGQAYLEMWCRLPGKGEYFSRSLDKPISGTMDWSTEQTPFFLQKGQKPDLIKLNVVIKGKGTLWIDDIKLVKGPLQ